MSGGEGQELIAFILYVDMFFSPIQQLSQVFDSWQQTRVSVGRISQLMQLETLTPPPAQPSHSSMLVLRQIAHPSASTHQSQTEMQANRSPLDQGLEEN